MASTSKITAWLSDDTGSASIMNIFLVIFCLMMAAIAVDSSMSYRTRAQMQLVTDAASFAALQQIAREDLTPEERIDLGRGAARFVVEQSMPVGTEDMILDEDIQFGQWTEAGEFIVDEVPPDAVQITARRIDGRGNALPTMFYGFVGVDTIQAATRSMAQITPPPVAQTFTPPCSDSVFLSDNEIDIAAQIEVRGNHCFYANNFLQTTGDDLLAQGLRLVAPGASNFFIASRRDGSGPMGATPDEEDDDLWATGNYSSVVVSDLDDMFNDAWQFLDNEISRNRPFNFERAFDLLLDSTADSLGDADAGRPPPEEDGGWQIWSRDDEDYYLIENAGDVTESNYIYVVDKDLDIRMWGNHTISDVVFLVNGDVHLENDGGDDQKDLFQDVIIFASGNITLYGDFDFGSSVECGGGVYNTYLLAGGDIAWDAGDAYNSELRDVYIAANSFTAPQTVMEMYGVYIEAKDRIELGPRNKVEPCTSMLQSTLPVNRLLFTEDVEQPEDPPETNVTTRGSTLQMKRPSFLE